VLILLLYPYSTASVRVKNEMGAKALIGESEYIDGEFVERSRLRRSFDKVRACRPRRD